MSSSSRETILVTGAKGQLGQEIRDIAESFPRYNFFFADRQDLAIENKQAVEDFFAKERIDFCINCAAYTAVDKAESDRGTAFLINGTAVGDLAAICRLHNTRLIHISTDYVYDGNTKEPLKENDNVAPINVYGASKLKGEELALKNNPDTLIIRTSWVYSQYGNNFVKTMMKLMVEKKELNIVSDQVGSPTYAADLADVIMRFIVQHSAGLHHTGIVNYSNYGITSWYQFAVYIKELIASVCILHPITSEQFPTPALRPQFSVLDTTLIRSLLQIEIPFWKNSVARCIKKIRNVEIP